MTNVYLVEIAEQPIELYKLLKIADLVSGGGEAKVVISEGYVLLNNEVEFQKRKKVYDGDYIQFGDNIIEVKFVGSFDIEYSQAETEVAPVKQSKKTSKNRNKTKNKTTEKAANKGKRRAISF